MASAICLGSSSHTVCSVGLLKAPECWEDNSSLFAMFSSVLFSQHGIGLLPHALMSPKLC